MLRAKVFRSNEAIGSIHYRASLNSIFSIATSSPDRISSARLLACSSRLIFPPDSVIFDVKNEPEASAFLLCVGEVMPHSQRRRKLSRRLAA